MECRTMEVNVLSLGPIGANCYILIKGDKCLIVDPGAEPETIEQYLSEKNVTPIAILLTHAHFDHIGAVDELRKKYDIDVYLHEAENDWLKDPMMNRSILFFGEDHAVKTADPDHHITVGKWELGGFQFEVRHTPGHSPGSVSYVFHDEKFVICGDTLFKQGIGRYDLPEGNYDQLMDSIYSELYSLDDDYVVYPGHGPQTTIGLEKKENPFTL